MLVEPKMLLPALLMLAIALIHLILGGRDIAKPLLEADHPSPVVIFTHYYCWHIVSMTLFALAAAFGFAAFAADALILARFATLLTIGFCIWGFALVLWKKQSHAQMPQWILFVVTSAAAIWSIT